MKYFSECAFFGAIAFVLTQALFFLYLGEPDLWDDIEAWKSEFIYIQTGEK